MAAVGSSACKFAQEARISETLIANAQLSHLEIVGSHKYRINSDVALLIDIRGILFLKLTKVHSE